MSLSGSFSYVLIPADPEKPIELRQGDKSGGLSDDYLVKSAKNYFFQQDEKGTRRAAAIGAVDSYTVQQRKTLAQSIREQMILSNPGAQQQLAAMPDENLLELIKATQSSTSCDIVALTVPTYVNKYKAVSMYAADNTDGMPLNPRATELLKACGHQPQPQSGDSNNGMRGDVFVGRCHDKEDSDVWERVDFTVEDVSPDAEWVRTSRKQGGGGGGGSAAASSLSGVMSQAFQPQQSPSAAAAATNTGTHDPGYTWTQTEEDVELVVPVEGAVKKKYVKMKFSKPNNIKITVNSNTVANGQLGGTVTEDECLVLIRDAEEKGKKELQVVLSKKNIGTLWPFAVQGGM